MKTMDSKVYTRPRNIPSLHQRYHPLVDSSSSVEQPTTPAIMAHIPLQSDKIFESHHTCEQLRVDIDGIDADVVLELNQNPLNRSEFNSPIYRLTSRRSSWRDFDIQPVSEPEHPKIKSLRRSRAITVQDYASLYPSILQAIQMRSGSTGSKAFTPSGSPGLQGSPVDSPSTPGSRRMQWPSAPPPSEDLACQTTLPVMDSFLSEVFSARQKIRASMHASSGDSLNASCQQDVQIEIKEPVDQPRAIRSCIDYIVDLGLFKDSEAPTCESH
jgi:hypothetical protein